jgi:hypothetical protein
MEMEMEMNIVAINRVLQATRKAYFFSPGSYTFKAMIAGLALMDREPDWVAEYLNYMETEDYDPGSN